MRWIVWVLLSGMAGAATLRPAGFDSAALTAVFALAKAGDTVELPAGDYRLTEPVRPPSGTHLLGADRDRTRLLWRGTKRNVAINVNGLEDVEFANLTIDGENTGLMDQGIAGQGARRLRIHHLTIQNLAKTGGWGPHGILFSGINPTCAQGVTDCEISDCRIEHVGVGAEYGGGIRLAWGSARNRVLRNRIHDTGRGGIFGDHSPDLTVRDNEVTGSGGEGLAIELWGGCPRSVVEDNRVDHWLSIDGGERTAVRRNVIRATDGSVKFLGIELIASQCVVTDNVVDTGQKIGLSVSNKQPKNDVFWGYNTVRDCVQWGSQLQGETGGIARHWFYRCRFEKMRRGDPGAIYPGYDGHGFRLNGDCRDLVLEDCQLVDNGGYGLQLGGPHVDRLTILGCTVTGNKGAAVDGPAKATAVEFSGCTVNGNGGNRLPANQPFATAPPKVTLTGPASLKVGESGTFTCGGDGLEHILWDLNDGLPEVTGTVQHSYPRPGTYRVTLVAWDAQGRGARVERPVVVRPAD